MSSFDESSNWSQYALFSPLNKRKRDEEKQYRRETRRVYNIRQLNLFYTLKLRSTDLKFVELFWTGDILSVAKTDSASFIRRYLQEEDIVFNNLPFSECNMNGKQLNFSVKQGVDGSRELLCVSPDGNIFLFVMEEDGRLSALHHEIKFADDEKITHASFGGKRRKISFISYRCLISFSDSKYLVGTSFENLVMLQRSGKTFIETNLTNKLNIFYGLIQTSAKLLGINPNKSLAHKNPTIRILSTKFVPVESSSSTSTLTDIIFQISPVSICIWSIAIPTSSCTLIANVMLPSILEISDNVDVQLECQDQDSSTIRSLHENTNDNERNLDPHSFSEPLEILDALIMPSAPLSTRTTIVLLIARPGSQPTDVEEVVTGDLFLCTFELLYSQRNLAPLQILWIASGAALNSIHVPRLHGVLDRPPLAASSASQGDSIYEGQCTSWLVYASWTAVTRRPLSSSTASLPQDGSAVDGRRGTMALGYYDIRTLPPRLSPGLAVAQSLDTGVAVDAVLGVQAVLGIDGLSLLLLGTGAEPDARTDKPAV